MPSIGRKRKPGSGKTFKPRTSGSSRWAVMGTACSDQSLIKLMEMRINTE
jgi:hypothetical protein